MKQLIGKAKKIIIISIFSFLNGCSKESMQYDFLALPIFRDNVKENQFYYQGKEDDLLVICTKTTSCKIWEGFDYMAGAHSKCYEVIDQDVKASFSDYKKYLPEANTLTLYTGKFMLPKSEVSVDAFNQLLTNHFVEIPTIFEIHDLSMDKEYADTYEYIYTDQGIQKTRLYEVTYVEEGMFLKITDSWTIEDEAINNYERFKLERLSFTFFYAE